MNESIILSPHNQTSVNHLNSDTVDPSNEIGQILKAVENGAPVEVIEKLVALKIRIDQQRAIKAFNEALARFKALCPPIPKDAAFSGMTKDGRRYGYQYSSQEVIVRTIQPYISQCGLAFRWETEYDNNSIIISCVISHKEGHSIKGDVVVPQGTEIRKTAENIGWGKRISISIALGLVSEKDMHEPDANLIVEHISEKQVSQLVELIDESGANEEKFLEFIGASDIEMIPKQKFALALQALRRKYDSTRRQ